MSKTSELLDKAVLLALLQDQFAEQYYDEALYHFRKLTRRIGRILSPEYGAVLSLARRRELVAEIQEEVDEYEERLRLLAHSQLTEAATEFYNEEKKIVEDVDPGNTYADPPDLSRSMFTQYHAMNRGEVLQLEAMYRTHIRLIQDSYKDIVNRLSAIVEDTPVARGYFTAATNRNQNFLNSISITAVMFAASIARRAFFDRNKRRFRGYQWVSVLDSRTTDYCQSRHLLTWYYNEPELSTLAAEEHPPGHFRCRSITVPIFIGDEAVESPSFEEWFERQPTETKREILGPTRYRLYADGQISISDVNDGLGRRRTLEELRELIG